jgi:uncharacterized protein
MTSILITSIYAAVLAIIMIALSSHVSAQRGKVNVSILDGGNAELALRMRRHGNFVENVPMALLLMALAELDGVGHNWIHAAGVLLVIGRILHAMGLSAEKATALRLAGGVASTLSVLLMVGNILYLAFAK